MVARLWTFPLFFADRSRIDLLNAPHFDTLFDLLRLCPDPEGMPKEGDADRLKWARVCNGRATVEQIAACAILEAYEWQFDTLAAPSYWLAKEPIESPRSAEDAARIVSHLAAYYGDNTESPWRAICFYFGIAQHCTPYRDELKEWESLSHPGRAEWSRYPLHVQGWADWSQPCKARVNVILR